MYESRFCLGNRCGIHSIQFGWNDLSGSAQRIYALRLCEKSERRYDGGFSSAGIAGIAGIHWSVGSGLLVMLVFGPRYFLS